MRVFQRKQNRTPTGIPLVKMAVIGLLPTFLKRIYYRLRGATLGNRVSFGLFSLLESSSIEVGDDSRISPFTFIRAREGIKIGKRVRIHSFVAADTGYVEVGDDSVIMEQVVIGGMLTPRSRIRIGKRVKIFPFCFLNPTEPINIEDDVGVGGANYLFTHGSWQSSLDGFPVAFGPITLKKGVWLPWCVFIMPNVTVGEYATIGAGSVLTKDIPARSLAVGSPAKVVRQGSGYIKEHSVQMKNEMVLGHLKEFAEFLGYTGWEVESNFDSDSAILCIRGGTRITYDKFFVDRERNSQDIAIVLEPMTIDQRKELDRDNVSWFDISSGLCRLRRSDLWEETRNYFSRIGVRFDVEDDEE